VAANGSDRLDSWKEIASFIGRDVRTARRWEKDLGMPVHRDPGAAQGRVYALRSELEPWLASQEQRQLNGGTMPDEAVEPPVFMVSPLPESAIPHFPESPADSAPEPVSRGTSETSGGPRSIPFWLWVAVPVASLCFLLLASNRLVHSYFQPPRPRLERVMELPGDREPKENLFTDGSTLYFNAVVGYREVLASTPAIGGPTREIPTPFPNVRLLDLSRDGQSLLVNSHEGMEEDRPLWMLPVSGGPARRLGNVLCHSAQWSSDGQKIIFAKGTSIYLANPQGEGLMLVKTFRDFPSQLRWSPEGGKLRFVLTNLSAYSKSPWELQFDGRPDSSKLSPLDFGRGCCAQWSWTRSGEYFLYASGEGLPTSVFAVHERADGALPNRSSESELPLDLNTFDGLAVGENAHRLFVLKQSQEKGELLRYDVRSGEFTTYLQGLSGTYISWSRDGEWIAYSGLPAGTLWRSRPDGSSPLQLFHGATTDVLSSWSPDGRQIAFHTELPGRPWRIYLISRDGGPVREASEGDDNQGAPSWSPGGKFIAYGTVLCLETETCQIRVIDLDTRKVTTLPGSSGLRTARWSPDGKYIAAIRSETHQVCLFDVATKRWRTLTNQALSDDLSWSHDSRYLYFSNPQGLSPAIYRVRTADGKLELVSNLLGLQKLPGGLDRWFGLAPDDSPILHRMVRQDAILQVDWAEQ